MAIRLAARVRAIEPSPTMGMDAKTKAMLAEGIDVVNFSVGEPDFDTPAHIAEAGIEAVRRGFTRYTAAAGIPELREAICRKLRRDNGLEYSPAEVIVSVGAKHSLYNCFQATCEPGDEVILQAPYWVTYPEQIRLAGGIPVVLPTDESTGFKLTPERVERAITPKSRILLLCSPANPTGAVYTEDELRALAEVAARHDLVVISDEIYEKLVYGGARHVSIAGFPGMRERTLVVNGVSKAYAMTGWRIGYTAGPRHVVEAMSALQGHSTSNPASIAQKAAVAALDGPEEPIRQMVAEFAVRRDALLQRLQALPGVTCAPAEGAFYLFPNFRGLLGRVIAGRRIDDTDQLAELFLDEARVATVPGAGFGAPDNIRFSYSTSLERIHEGLDRIEALLRRA